MSLPIPPRAPSWGTSPFRRDNALALALEATLTSVWDYDVVANRVTFDPNWSRMLGGPAAEIVWPIRQAFEQVHPEDRKRAAAASFACLSGRTEEYSQEYRILDQRAGWIWVHSRGRVMQRDAHGRAVRMIGTNIDVTRRKTDELATTRQLDFLRALNQTAVALLERRAKNEVLDALVARTAALLDAVEVDVALVDGDELVTHAQGGARQAAPKRRAGRQESPSAWQAMDMRRPVIGGERSDPSEGGAVAASDGDRPLAVFPILHQERCLGVLSVLRDRPGHGFSDEECAQGKLLAQLAALVIHNASIYEDAVTVAEQRAAALVAHERTFRHFIENIDQGFYTADHRGIFSYFNPAIGAVTGWTEEELRGSSSFRLVVPEDRSRVVALYRAAAAGDQPGLTVEFQVETKAGRRLWVEQTTSIVRRPDGRVQEFRNFLRNITDRRLAEMAVRESEALFKGVFDASPIPIVLLTFPEGRIQAINQATARVFGFTAAEAVGRTTTELEVWPVLAIRDALLQRVAASGAIQLTEVDLRRKDGRIIHTLFSVGMLMVSGRRSILVSILDVTAQKETEAALQRSEKQLRQAQKLESLGTLAGGIAHDFNNILTGILGFTQLALADLDPGHPAAPWLDGVLKSGDRARGLVQQILTFSRRTETARLPIRLHTVVGESADLLRSTLPAMVRLERQIEPGCPPVMADPTEMHQVVLNLCTNAWHALPEQGGVIELGLAPCELDEDFVRMHPPLTAGRYVRLSVEDNGKGMTPAILERIFEPFFTTKEAGKGTGLGLAVVHSVVTAHAGTITVRSSPGRGTRFDIFLPALATASPVAEPAPVTAPPQGQGQRVLVVDDDSLSGSAVSQLLARLGYNTTLCADPFEAIARLYSEPFDVLVTDLAMPGLPGDELARQALDRRPDLPVLLLSGFIEPAKQAQLRGFGVREVLGKPATVDELARAIDRCVRSPARPRQT